MERNWGSWATASDQTLIQLDSFNFYKNTTGAYHSHMDFKLNKCNLKTTKLLFTVYRQNADIFKIENAPRIRYEMENLAILLFI